MRKLTNVLFLGALLLPFTFAFGQDCGAPIFDELGPGASVIGVSPGMVGNPRAATSPGCMAATLCVTANGGVHIASNLEGLNFLSPGANAICAHPGIPQT